MRFLLLLLIIASCAVIGESKCENWCNQRGQCTSSGPDGECLCDMGYTGDDCGLRMCPMSFDPLVLPTLKNRRSVRLVFGVDVGKLSGYLEFSFAGATVYLDPQPYDFDTRICTERLSGLKSVEEVTCYRESFDEEKYTASYLITFHSYPEKPFMSNHIVHNGNPPLDMFSCSTHRLTADPLAQPYCDITDVVTEDLPEYKACGGHGICDVSRGTCQCETGFRGISCRDNRDDQDLNVTYHEGPFFTANLMKLQIRRSESPEFNFFQTKINDQPVTTLRGDRLLAHRGNLLVAGGTVRAQSLQPSIPAPTQKEQDAQQRQVSAFEATAALDDAHFASYISPANDRDNHFLARHGQQAVFQVDRNGDVALAGSLSADAGGFTVGSGLISGRSMKLDDFLDVHGTLNVDGALTLGSEFALTPLGMSIDVSHHSGALLDIRSREASFNGSLFELHSAGTDATFIRAVNQGKTTFELLTSGLLKLSGVRLLSGGIDVEAGGVSVRAGGLSVRGGISLESGELKLLNRKFHLGSLLLETTSSDGENENREEPLLRGRVHSKEYVGDILSLSAPQQESEASALNYNVLSFAKEDPAGIKPRQSIFQVKQDGHIESAAGAHFQGAAGVTMDTPLTLRDKLTLRQEVVEAAWDGQKWTARVPASASYVILRKAAAALTDANTAQTVAVSFDFGALSQEDRSREAGRTMIFSNADTASSAVLSPSASAGGGELSVPAETTILLVFNGRDWADLHALKAPMTSLTRIQRLEAAADLHIGNHSLSAARFQATAATPGSVLFVGKNSFLSEHRGKFTYSRGLLTAPALKIDKLAGGLDGQGHEATNLLLTNAKLTGASVQASEFFLQGQSLGLAFFNAKGQLQSSPALALDEDNQLVIRELLADVAGHGRTIRDVKISSAELTDVADGQFARLHLGPSPSSADSPASTTSTSSSSTSGAVLVLDEMNEVLPASTAHLRYDAAAGRLSVANISIGSLVGPVHGNGQTVSAITLTASNLTAIGSVSTAEIVVESLRSAEASQQTMTRLVYTDATGRLQAYTTAETEIEIPHLLVHRLSFAPGPVDFQGRTLSNLRLDAASVDFGRPAELVVRSLVVEGNEVKNAKAGGLDQDEDHFLFSQPSGRLAILPGLTINSKGRRLSFADFSLAAAELQTAALRFPTPHGLETLGLSQADSATPSAPLGLNEKTGRVGLLAAAGLQELTVSSRLVLAEGAEVFFEQKRRPAAASSTSSASSGLLGVDAAGRLVKISAAPDSTDGRLRPSKEAAINGQFRDLAAVTASSERSSAEVVEVEAALLLGQKFLASHNLVAGSGGRRGAGGSSHGHLLGVDGAGRVGAEAKVRLSYEDHSLRLNHLQPFEAGDRLLIESARLEKSELVGSAVTAAPSVSTNTLTVHNFAEFRSDATVMGSLMVYGSVSGSGAYIDTSDRRFKRNIRNVTAALDLIDQLQAVRYEFRTEEFPQYRFANDTQLGWIAQDVAAVLPELVEQDPATGYYALAYAHACPLLAEGIKELRAEHRQELAAVREEFEKKVDGLQAEVRELKDLVERLLRAKA